MGRHPECKVHRDDMHVALQHFAIVGDHVAGWHLECLTPDGCVVVHERTVKMGRPRKLKHGDAIVVMVYKKSGKEDRKPLIGYRFEVGAISTAQCPTPSWCFGQKTSAARHTLHPNPGLVLSMTSASRHDHRSHGADEASEMRRASHSASRQ